MPFIGLGLHILIALICAVHAMRTGQPMYWLLILFMFPLLGSLVYVLAVYLPNSRLERKAFKAVASAAKTIDPGREVRAAREAFGTTPTAQNQMRLAAALLEAGEAEEAASLYETALQGPFASDPDIRLGAARALVASGRFAQALTHVQALQSERSAFRADALQLLLARCLAGTGRKAEAREAFEQAIARFGSFEAHAEYAIWALGEGDAATAARLQTQIDAITRQWNAMNREMNGEVLRRLNAAQQRLHAGHAAMGMTP